MVISIHLIAALFLPWTVREATKALLMLCAMGFASSLVYATTRWTNRLALVFLPFAGLPGIIVCWLRHSRLRRRVALKHLTHRYGALKHQLAHARVSHETLFPEPVREGSIRMTYSYEPMLDIGGDFLDARPCLDGAISVVVVDVNGHGIGAALSVNRVYGELERIFGENENLRPDDVLSAMNHYLLVTLARKEVFATAFSLRVEPGVRELAWANAGHPPGLVVRKSGELRMLESHAVMLGVLDDGAFQCQLQQTALNDADRLIVFTDGASESQDREARPLDIEGFAALVRKQPVQSGGPSVAERLLHEVQVYRDGPPVDDTLIVEVFRAPAV